MIHISLGADECICNFLTFVPDIGGPSLMSKCVTVTNVTGSVRRDRDSESLTLNERGGKWESDQEREREKGRLNEGHGGSV